MPYMGILFHQCQQREEGLALCYFRKPRNRENETKAARVEVSENLSHVEYGLFH